MSTTAIADSAQATQQNLYYISVETNNIISSIGINGIPLLQDNEGLGRRVNWPISSWIMNGDNTINVALKKTSKDQKVAPYFDIKVFLHDPSSDIPKPKEIYVHYASKEVVEKHGEISLPFVGTANFNFNKPTPTKLWSEARQLTDLTMSHKQNIVKLVNYLEQSILNKKVDNVLKLQQYKIHEDAVAEGHPINEIEDAVRTNYEWLFKTYQFDGSILTLDEADFRLCGNNKIVYVYRKNGKPAVFFRTKDEEFDIPVYIAIINNTWTIVR